MLNMVRYILRFRLKFFRIQASTSMFGFYYYWSFSINGTFDINNIFDILIYIDIDILVFCRVYSLKKFVL